MRRLASDVAGIQAACHCCVGRSLDDRPPVGKQGHLIGLAPKLQNKFVVTNASEREQPRAQFRKIYRPFPLMNLPRVSPTQGDMRTALARQMHKVSGTDPASGSR